jgi:hypothetical protein
MSNQIRSTPAPIRNAAFIPMSEAQGLSAAAFGKEEGRVHFIVEAAWVAEGIRISKEVANTEVGAQLFPACIGFPHSIVDGLEHRLGAAREGSIVSNAQALVGWSHFVTGSSVYTTLIDIAETVEVMQQGARPGCSARCAIIHRRHRCGGM